MKKTQFFSAENIDSLQAKVNRWLAKNKEIGIIETGLTSAPEGRNTVFSFYVLYEVLDSAATVAIAEQMETIIPATENLSQTDEAQLQ